MRVFWFALFLFKALGLTFDIVGLVTHTHIANVVTLTEIMIRFERKRR